MSVDLGATSDPAADPEPVASAAGTEPEIRADVPAGTAFLKVRASDGPGCIGPWRA